MQSIQKQFRKNLNNFKKYRFGSGLISEKKFSVNFRLTVRSEDLVPHWKENSCMIKRV